MIFSKPETVPTDFHLRNILSAFWDAGVALTLACCSPRTCLIDLFNAAMSGTSAFSPFVDRGVLIIVCNGFILAARIIQQRNMMKGM